MIGDENEDAALSATSVESSQNTLTKIADSDAFSAEKESPCKVVFSTHVNEFRRSISKEKSPSIFLKQKASSTPSTSKQHHLGQAALSAGTSECKNNAVDNKNVRKNYSTRGKRGGKKRNRNATLTPPDVRAASKKPKNNETAESAPSVKTYSEVLNESLWVIVYNDNSRDGLITEAEGMLILKELDKLLFSDMTLLEKTMFEWSGMKNSRLQFMCTNTESCDWLKRVVPTLKAGEGAAFKVIPRSEIPKPIRASISVPQYVEADAKGILKRLEIQNPGIITGAWRIFSDTKHTDGSRIIYFGIDPKDKEIINTREGRLYLGLGRVAVRMYGASEPDVEKKV